MMSEITMEPQLPRSSPARPNRISIGRIAGFGLLAIVLAVIANFIVLTLVVNLLGLPEFGALSPVMVISLTAIGVLLATLVFAIVSRIAQNPARVFGIIAVIALLISFVPNVLSLAGMPSLIRLPNFGGRVGQQGGPRPNGGAQNSGAQNSGAQAGTQNPNASADSGTNGQGNAQQNGGRFQRNGQGFGAARIPMQLSLMALHVVAFVITLVVLTRATVVSTSDPKRE